MKKIITAIFITFFFFSAFAQKKDSLLIVKNKPLFVATDTLVSSAAKDSTFVEKDSLKNKNFFAKRAEKIGKWSKPKKAAMLSLVLPGAGQIYNKKGVWWRLPLCYGAYSAAIITHIGLRKNYFYFKDIYDWRVNEQNKIPQGEFPTKLYGKNVPTAYKTLELSSIYNQKNRQREPFERSFIWMGAAHLYCVADAFVTAHLMAFDITDDLSLKVQPKYDMVSQKPMLGLALQF